MEKKILHISMEKKGKKKKNKEKYIHHLQIVLRRIL